MDMILWENSSELLSDSHVLLSQFEQLTTIEKFGYS